MIEETELEARKFLLPQEQKRARLCAREAYFDSLTPQQLADRLHASLDLADIKDMNLLTERLEKQAHTLDAVFYTSLYQAGFGLEHHLEKDPTQTALFAQRQTRQTFDTLKKAEILQETKSGKEKE